MEAYMVMPTSDDAAVSSFGSAVLSELGGPQCGLLSAVSSTTDKFKLVGVPLSIAVSSTLLEGGLPAEASTRGRLTDRPELTFVEASNKTLRFEGANLIESLQQESLSSAAG